uniref:Activin_recp domain-containing protein n=1 Tax=Rhabditophanes sp. KR3021 TaxID=114890 RepID=A0AC35UEJ1_9BILA
MVTAKVYRLLVTTTLLFNCLVNDCDATKCLDCVGEDCMGSFCEGDYCMVGSYAPRWGSTEWGKPTTVKGCLTGDMINPKLKDHCETAERDPSKLFACFCKDKQNCNASANQKKLPQQPISLLKCACKGSHCEGKKYCRGELCSYVVNHRTRAFEQGCINGSVPLIERRTAGACMMPPITGAMHHTLAKSAEDLVRTESCLCGTDMCNLRKPTIKTSEKMNCPANIKLTFMGTTSISANISCEGEFCYKVKIQSKLGLMSYYDSYGCVSYQEGAELAEEFKPTGCARFMNEKLEVKACFNTDDKKAIARAWANQEQAIRRKGGKKPSKMEIDEFDESEEDTGAEEAEEEEEVRKKVSKPSKESFAKDDRGEEFDEEEDEEESKGKESESEVQDKTKEKEEKEEKEDGKKVKETEVLSTTPHFIFQRITEAPAVEDSNTALISVFGLIMLLILLSGAIWKLELHKKLMRSNYDSVAGG